MKEPLIKRRVDGQRSRSETEERWRRNQAELINAGALSLTRISPAFFSQATIVSSSAVNGVASGGAPTAMYRPNFSQAFQRAGPTTVPPTLSAGLYPTQSFTSGLLSNGTQSNTTCRCQSKFAFVVFWMLWGKLKKLGNREVG